METRAESMARMYGETVTKAQAARILGVTPNTVVAMLKDGRIRPACEGTRVDTRGIAEYIERPEQKCDEARKRKVMAKRGTAFAV